MSSPNKRKSEVISFRVPHNIKEELDKLEDKGMFLRLNLFGCVSEVKYKKLALMIENERLIDIIRLKGQVLNSYNKCKSICSMCESARDKEEVKIDFVNVLENQMKLNEDEKFTRFVKNQIHRIKNL